jgi:hypothetical protein
MKKILLITIIIFMETISHAQSLDSLAKENDNIDCSSLKKTIDEFTDVITYKAKISNEVDFLKIIKDGVSNYYLSIWIKEPGIYTGKGVNLILKNGEKLNKPDAEVGYSYAGGNFYTTTFIKLNKDDIALLKQSGIEKYKVYISTGKISDSTDFPKNLFNCLIKAK